MTRILIAAGKGGTGKTTVAVGLAWQYTRTHQRVELLDSDPQDEGSATNWLDNLRVEAPPNLYWSDYQLTEIDQWARYDTEGTPNIIDSPGFDAKALRTLAERSNIIVIPTPLQLMSAAIQTTLNLRPSGTPIIHVITGTETNIINSERGQAILNDAATIHGVTPIATIPYFPSLKFAAAEGLLPQQILHGYVRHTLTDAFAQLAAHIPA